MASTSKDVDSASGSAVTVLPPLREDGTARNARVGVLDIGSNAAQLQIVDVRPGGPPLPAYRVKHRTGLGSQIGDDGTITPKGIERVAGATREAVAAATAHEVGRLFVFATAAVRDADNRQEVLDRVESLTKVRPEYLSGEDEARLTYTAVHRWYGWSAGRLLLLDIGGGSMEIALGRDAEPDLAVSLPLGAGRLTRAFLPDDPPARADVKALRRHIRSTLREVTDRLRWEGAPACAIGTSKTFKQLARLTGSPPQRKGPFVPRSVDAADLDRWLPRLAKMPSKKRAKLQGVKRARAQQLLAGTLVARLTMEALDLRRVEVCPWALREGILLHAIGQRARTEV
ncbi:MAG TPA: Ppx/GppA phosphatase family protein [Jatrophihabitans sp.]|nr:Ppx/GppA phosphatase family protein [Jatrophihabitans sp.]